MPALSDFLARRAPWAMRDGRLSPTVRFSLIALGLLLGGAALARLIFRLEFFDAGPHVVFALTLGVVATIGLAVALMAAVFYSSRSGMDEARGEEDDANR